MRKTKLLNASLEALKDRPPELIPTFGFKIGPDVNFKILDSKFTRISLLNDRSRARGRKEYLSLL